MRLFKFKYRKMLLVEKKKNKNSWSNVNPTKTSQSRTIYHTYIYMFRYTCVFTWFFFLKISNNFDKILFVYILLYNLFKGTIWYLLHSMFNFRYSTVQKIFKEVQFIFMWKISVIHLSFSTRSKDFFYFQKIKFIWSA